MKNGSVYQRHLKRCPRDAHGQLLPHRCKGPWAYQFDLERGLDGRRRQETKTGFLAITADLYTHVSPVVAGTAADAIASIVPRRGHAAAVPDASAMQAPAPGALPTEHGSGGETAGEEGWAARGSNPEPAD